MDKNNGPNASLVASPTGARQLPAQRPTFHFLVDPYRAANDTLGIFLFFGLEFSASLETELLLRKTVHVDWQVIGED